MSTLSVRLESQGEPVDAPRLMLVANHVSWLDIFAIDATLPARFVAKSEIRRWPLVGWLCEQAGTVFIRQARRHDTVRLNSEIAAALSAGEVFAVFPEGTTTDGSAVLKFHSSLIEPALAADAAVQPVAIRYERSDGSLCDEVAYDGDKSLWDTVRALTTQRVIVARVTFLAPVPGANRHRRDIARDARDAILLALRPGAPDNRTDKYGGRRASPP